MFFSLFRSGKTVIEGSVVDLRIEYEKQADRWNDYVPSVIFGIYRHRGNVKIGETDLRLGMNEQLYYAGNIGYRIYEQHRGHGYAYEAAKLLMKTAYERYGMDELIMTCSPENVASRKTIEKLGGELIETVDVPRSHWLYKRGETVKNIYRFQLSE